MKRFKCKIKSTNKTFQQYLKTGRKITDFEIVNKEAAELSEMTQNQREKYFYDLPLKLDNPQTNPKTYWSIIKSYYNSRKIPIIPPLSVNGKNITNFKEKANLFNKYFSSQCNSLPNDSNFHKIKHILQKQNYHLLILRMEMYTK